MELTYQLGLFIFAGISVVGVALGLAWIEAAPRERPQQRQRR